VRLCFVKFKNVTYRCGFSFAYAERFCQLLLWRSFVSQAQGPTTEGKSNGNFNDWMIERLEGCYMEGDSEYFDVHSTLLDGTITVITRGTPFPHPYSYSSIPSPMQTNNKQHTNKKHKQTHLHWLPFHLKSLQVFQQFIVEIRRANCRRECEHGFHGSFLIYLVNVFGLVCFVCFSNVTAITH
jgi:hypothetical protein